MPFWFWRLFYGFLDTRFAVAGMRLVLAVARSIFGAPVEDAVLNRLSGWFVWSGWPHYGYGWVNLHMSRLHARLRLGARPQTPRRPATGRSDRLRVGLVGRFVGSLGFPKRLFAAVPASVDLVIIDLPYGGQWAGYLREHAVAYEEIHDEPGAPEATAAAVAAAANRAGLDLLVNVLDRYEAYRIIDAVDAHCIAHYCSGSDVIHHPKVDFTLYCQPQADYFVRDERLFCGMTRAALSGQIAYSTIPHYDLRDIDPGAVRPWREREPLIVFHGSLYKLAQRPYLECLFGLLQSDAALRFAFMGKNNRGSLARITEIAREMGVAGQVQYEGLFNSTRGSSGGVSDPGWQRMRSLLDRARLAANPWPIGGGSAVVEAYATGVPCVTRRVRFDEASWNRWQPVFLEVTALHVPYGTATDDESYLDSCRRALYDEAFAAALVAEQLACARRVTDGAAWWAQLLECHARWQRQTKAAA